MPNGDESQQPSIRNDRMVAGALKPRELSATGCCVACFLMAFQEFADFRLSKASAVRRVFDSPCLKSGGYLRLREKLIIISGVFSSFGASLSATADQTAVPALDLDSYGFHLGVRA